MESKRVNHVVVGNITSPSQPISIKLMKTNDTQLIFDTGYLGIPPYSAISSKITRTRYRQHIEQKVIQLLKDGKIMGFHWDDKKESAPVVKYLTEGMFQASAQNRVLESLEGTWKIDSSKVSVEQRYNDGSLCNATAEIWVSSCPREYQFYVYLRSGQISKPKKGGHIK